MMLGAGRVTAYNLDGASIGDSVSREYLGGEDSATAAVQLGDDGQLLTANSGDSFWATPAGMAPSAYAGFWARLSSYTGDTLANGVLNTWIQLGVSEPLWALSLAAVGTKSGSGTLEIATDSGGSNVVATATLSLSIELT